MDTPLSTGQAARRLGLTEPQLAQAVRLGKVPSPPIVAGRRLWTLDLLRRAARILGLALDFETLSPDSSDGSSVAAEEPTS